MKAIALSAIKQGIQRLREKGSPDPSSLYDLRDGYVTIDGSAKQRPGTELAYGLPAGTLGMCAHDGDLVVFSTSPKACPTGTRCEVLTHPFFPSQGLTYIHYAAPFLGYLYVAAEFENGDVYHYWLQAANEWEASTTYMEGQIIVPSTPNGLGYKAHRVLPKYPTWVSGMEVVLGTKVEPTTANGYYYEATATSEAAGVGTPGGSPNPTPPGDPPGDGGPSDPPPTTGELFGQSGNLPDAIVGSAYILMRDDDPFSATGGYTDAHVFGEVLPGVGASGSAPMSSSFRTTGTPLTAGAEVSDLEFSASAPWVGGFGDSTVAQSITVAAKPTYSLPDWRFRQAFGNALADTTPPWTTLVMDGTAGDGMVSIGAVSAGKVRHEFVITGTSSGVYIGITARHGVASASMAGGLAILPTLPNTVAYSALAGTWAIELDASTGDWDVLNSSAVIVASGNLPLPSGKLYRFAWYSETAQAGTVYMNGGNQAWAIAATVGFGGMPFGTVNVPGAWRKAIPTNGGMLAGDGFLGPCVRQKGGPRHMFGTQGVSSGKWRVGLYTSSGSRVGWAKGAYTLASGALGAAGTADSIGWDDAAGVLHWCFGGVHGEQAIVTAAGTKVFAIDLAAGEFRLYSGDGATLLGTPLTGVPAGTWYPCESGASIYTTVTYNPAGPATFNDWQASV